MKTSAFLRPVRAATGNTRLWIQSRLARVDARHVMLGSPALLLTIAVLILALPAISALQGNTTTADVSAEINKTRSVAIGDIDGDGFPDIAVANEGNERNRVYFGDGSGGISSSMDIGTLQETTDSIDLADVDQDGFLDVVIGNRSTTQPSRLYTWDAPNRRFDFRVTHLNDEMHLRMTSDARFVDVDVDGDPDVVVANRNARNGVFFGTGIPGQFAFDRYEPLQDSATSDSSSIAVGNLTEDNCPDLVVGNRRNVRNDLYINAGDCSGYAGRLDLSTDQDYTDWIEIADINNDGNNDVITGNRLQPNKYLLGNGTANNPFQPSKAISPDADYTRDIRAVDVDSDGDLDIIAANAAPAPNKLYLNRLMESGALGFDAFIALPSISDSDATSIAVCGPPDCDFDGDGDVDLVFGNNGPVGSNRGAINRIVFNNNENPLFTSEPIEGATTGAPYTYEVTTFDPDRAQALVITGSGLGWLTLVDHGDGTATLSGNPGASPQSVSLAVTDADGSAANQNFSIAVSASNQAPAISSGAAPTSVTQDTVPATPNYAHLFTATDPDNAGSELDFSASTLPSWMTLIDNGDGSANLSGAPVQGDVGDHAVIVRVTDPAGRVDEESFVVTVIDGNDRPVAVDDHIQTSNGATVTRLGPQEPDYDAVNLLWNDFDADGDVLVASLTVQATAGTATVNPDGTFQYVHGGGGAGTDRFRYRVVDGSDGQQAWVNIAIDVAADTIAPVITLQGAAVVTVTVGDAYTDAGATALDNVDGDLTSAIDTVNPVDVNTAGSYTVTYNVSDAAGNAAIEVTRTVNVVAVADTTAPVITRLGSATVSLTVGAAYTDAGATAVDDVDGDITANIVTTNPVNTATTGTYTVRYNVSDAAGNAATEVTRTVTVTNPAPPPPPPRNSGGGSAGVLELLGMILLAGMSRRRMRLTRRSI